MVIRRGQRNASVRQAAQEVGCGENAAVLRKMSQWEVGEEREGVLPGSAKTEGMQKRTQGGRVRQGRPGPAPGGVRQSIESAENGTGVTGRADQGPGVTTRARDRFA